MNEKQCTGCGTTYPIDHYIRVKRSRDGYSQRCRACRSANALRWKEENRERALELERNRRRAKKENGQCAACTRERLPHSNNFCEDCYYRDVAYHAIGSGTKSIIEALRQKMIDQDYKCPYTNVPLILGLNASLDHMMPKSRFPELARDINNLEWVSADINQSKHDRTPDEFVALCAKIIQYTEAHSDY